MTTLSKIILTCVACLGIAMTVNAEKLVILHTNDTHSLIDPDKDGKGGVARRKVVIDSVRAANPGHTLLVDAGDVVQGTLFFNLYFGELEEKLMNYLDYDIRILGNHEFDNGLDSLAKNLKTAEAELVCTNYQFRNTPLEDMFKRYTIREVDGKRIGFIALNIKPEGMITQRNYTGMGYTDAIQAANTTAKFLKEVEQVDAVVALSHLGYDKKNLNDTIFVKASTDIDLVLGGHSHTVIDPEHPEKSVPYIVKNADGKPVVIAQTGKDGKYISQVTIDLDNLSALPEYRLIPIDSRLDDRLDPKVAEIIKPYRDTVDALNSNMIATVDHDMAHRCDELINFAGDFVYYIGKKMDPDLDFAIINKGGLRHALKKGPLSEGEVITLMPFFNKILVAELPGNRVIELFDSIAADGGNGVSRQISARFDKDAEKAEVRLNGKPIDPNRTYRIATIDYLFEGGDYMSPFKYGTLIYQRPTYLYQDLVDYLKTGPFKNKPIKADKKPRMVPAKLN